jgi:4-amino-4-deoxy-L-arabinose transferase-like glycosyltransferase
MIDRNHVLWNQWYGGKTFHQEPLYAYLLAIGFAVFGAGLGKVYLVQGLLGLAGIWLVYDLSRRLFSLRVAKVAAVLAVLYGPMVFYEATVLRSSWIAFSSLLLVWLASLAREKGKLWMWAGLGIGCGVAILLKSNLLLFLAGMNGLLLLDLRRHWRRTLLQGGILTTGALLALTPLMTRNLMVGVSPMQLSGVTPVTFAAANLPDANPIRFDPIKEEVIRIMEKTGGKSFPVLLETLEHHSPVSYLSLAFEKLKAVFHWYETPNSMNFYYSRLHSNVLGYLPVSSALILSLALPALFLLRTRFQQTAPLLLMLGVHLGTLLLVIVYARYRLPMVICCIPFAALTIVQTYEAFHRKAFKSAGLLALVFLVTFAYTNRPLPGEVNRVRVYDVMKSLEYYYYDKVNLAHSFGNPELVATIWRQFVEAEPPCVRRLETDPVPGNELARQLAHIYSQANAYYAEALETISEEEEARRRREYSRQLSAAANNAANGS